MNFNSTKIQIIAEDGHYSHFENRNNIRWSAGEDLDPKAILEA